MNQSNSTKLRVAIVHDFLLRMGGAERVLKVLAEMFPDAPIYTLLYDEKFCGRDFSQERVKTSYLQKLPKFIRNRHTLLLRSFPRAIESFDFTDFDVVISSSNSFAHGIITNLNTTHICYYHSPMRYVWDWYNEYFDDLKFGRLKRGLAKFVLHKIRMWDQLASRRPDISLANSENVKNRIHKYYHKDAEVVYPPVDLSRFKPLNDNSNAREPFFLIVSTLTPYKRIDLAVRFFNKVGKKLIIVGEGKSRSELEQMAGSNIEFKGFLKDDEIADLMSKCRGFIFSGEEDFGITPIEAMASGRPVFAYGKGGVIESVVDQKTGMFFAEPTLESFEEGFAKFLSWEKKFFDPKDAIERAKMFSKEKFEKAIRNVVQRLS